jgi:hypothetical protein
MGRVEMINVELIWTPALKLANSDIEPNFGFVQKTGIL